ncbi:MAG TPA: cysteine--tRNA ligase [Thermoplasmatales archaeon]|nr:cysteine--tRNA ligase [Thermoplasmatales archaeon]
MTLRIYNTLTRRKEKFVPIEKGKVKMYVCGMTVYSDSHIGHARTYLAFDIIRRYLEYKGYKVTYVQNITDVDDKIISAANEKGIDPLEYSKYYTERCLNDMDALGIRRADIYPKASENIQDMIEMIKKIIDNGYGYVSDGDVYFSVEKFREYGKLSKQKLEDMKAGARVEPGEKKKNPLDFALWKAAKPGEPKWNSPWGEGRPGWHIECSVMSAKYLGLPFDIHGGGMDLIFPHHENEIAQAEAAYGRGFARYWIHVGLLMVNGEKMSKSLGNILTIRDALEKYNAEVIRFFLASMHYRNPPNFTEAAMESAKNALEKIHRAYDLLSFYSRKDLKSDSGKNFLKVVDDVKKDFEKAMDDDFNTPQAIAVIFDFVDKIDRFVKSENIDSEVCKYARKTLVEMCNILTILQDVDKDGINLDEIIPLLDKYGYDKGKPSSAYEAIDILLDIREKARSEKNWDLADSIRNDLRGIGIEVEDTGKGPVWIRKRLV